MQKAMIVCDVYLSLAFFQPIEVTNNDDNLINFGMSWELFEETTSSNIATASLIGSCRIPCANFYLSLLLVYAN